MVHCNPVVEVSRSRPIVGSATVSPLKSMVMRRVVRAMVTTTHHLRLCSVIRCIFGPPHVRGHHVPSTKNNPPASPRRIISHHAATHPLDGLVVRADPATIDLHAMLIVGAGAKERFGLSQLASFLEGPAQEQTSLFAFFLRSGLFEHGSDGLFYSVGLEGHVGKRDYDLPDLTVHEVWLAGVYPTAAGQYPGPAFHADGVLYVFVLQAEHLDPEPVGGYYLGLYAYRRWHGHSLTAASRPAVRERALTLSWPRTCPRRGGRRGGASPGRRVGARRPCSPARACLSPGGRGRARRWPYRRRGPRRGRGRGAYRRGSSPAAATR